jgi:CO/xanthine dehydrogenase Mo-binding subunit/aerobic-type carbon monoxide dehydrogenase small subunit (CoxS/CutS family)
MNDSGISPAQNANEKNYSITVNGCLYNIQAKESDSLLEILREKLHLKGSKRGCDSGDCGACTVILGNRPVKSCRTHMKDVLNQPVITIEGLQADDGTLHPLQSAFLETGAVQCGFCTPGMIMAAFALLLQNANPGRKDIRRALQGNLCRCTGYQPIEAAVLKAAARMASSGTPAEKTDVHRDVLRIDGLAKVTGTALFTDDLDLESPLHGAVVWSSVPSGILQSIDTQAAMRVPGIARVLTADDIPGQNGVGRWRADRPLLVKDRIRFCGDAIALVLAETVNAAQQAAAVIRFNITPLPALFDPKQALLPGTGALHQNGNCAADIHIQKTSPSTKAEHNAVDYSDTFSTQFVEHALLEPETAAAFFENGTLVVVTPSQNVFYDRLEILRVLGLSSREMARVRIRELNTGAAFGKREDILVSPLAALGTWLTGRPVKITLNRKDSFLATTKRHPMRISHTSRVDSNNRILQQSITILADTGAYSSWAPNILRKCAVHATGPYYVPNATVHGVSVYTNNAFSGAMRGFGAVQAHLAAERHMDRIARTRNIDPLEFRKINALQPGLTTVTGQVIRHMTPVAALLDTAARSLPWTGPARGTRNTSGWAAGTGLGTSFYGIGYGNGIPDKGQVELVRHTDGTIELFTSAIDYGQGAKTVFAQIVAETLRVPISAVTITTGDTARTPDSGSSVASRQTFVTGNAVFTACKKLLALMKTSTPTTTPVSVKARYLMNSETLRTPDGQGDVYKTFSASAAAARVLVNRSTGEVVLEKIVSVHDSGTIINRLLAESQVTGGVMMAAGMALWENYIINKGVPETTGFLNYRIPRIQHVPDIQVIFMPTPDPDGPMGAKGLGEPAILAAVPAIVNAVCDALDIDLDHTPLNPETILSALVSHHSRQPNSQRAT